MGGAHFSIGEPCWVPENVKKRETASTAKTTKPSSKYSKKEVYELKKVFDEYDKDRSGSIDADEFKKELEAKKKANAPRPGQKSTLAQRQSQEGVSLVDLSGSVFDQMDKDGDGSVRPRPRAWRSLGVRSARARTLAHLAAHPPCTAPSRAGDV